jgi:hypothetical protein
MTRATRVASSSFFVPSILIEYAGRPVANGVEVSIDRYESAAVGHSARAKTNSA